MLHRIYKWKNGLRSSLLVSGMQYNRKMNELISGSPETRTVTLPNTVREVITHAFNGRHTLKSVILNAELEKIGPLAFSDT